MAVITRETLVLRDVSVLRDGLTVVARLGSGYPAEMQTPAPTFPMRHPQPFAAANQPEAERWSNPDDHRDASSRTGRSARTAGCLNRAVLGGSVPAARLTGLLADAVASADKIPSRTRGRTVSACPPWQAYKPGFTAGLTTSTGSTRWGPAGDRMS
jgi:hypothetical protein